MYAKLVLRNARRSIQDYLVYLLTMTICVTLFYSFLSISSSYYEPDIGTEYDFTMLSDGMKLAICAVTLILLFLIRFVNHYMLRRKQREFALQSVMGMEQRTIGRLFFAETFLMGLVCADGLILWTEHLVSPFLPKGWAFLVSKGVSIVGPFFLMYFVRKYAFQKLESKRKGS